MSRSKRMCCSSWWAFQASSKKISKKIATQRLFQLSKRTLAELGAVVACLGEVFLDALGTRDEDWTMCGFLFVTHTARPALLVLDFFL